MECVLTSPKNQIYYQVFRHFSAEGFHNLDVMKAFTEIGYSRAEAKRLLSNEAIKVWDTRASSDGTHMELFKRKANDFELIEPYGALLFGHPKTLIIKPEPIPFVKRLFWVIRPRIERWLGR